MSCKARTDIKIHAMHTGGGSSWVVSAAAGNVA